MTLIAETNFVVYDCGDDIGPAMFIRRCPVCEKFVKADKSVFINMLGEVFGEPNATCSKHGRVRMYFYGV